MNLVARVGVVLNALVAVAFGAQATVGLGLGRLLFRGPRFLLRRLAGPVGADDADPAAVRSDIEPVIARLGAVGVLRAVS